ncbi:MAG: DUF2889 domain-containing protein [Novosphingobium sp.]|nr:DUF2889 domain-containing protein [Novosphingobium sp.]
MSGSTQDVVDMATRGLDLSGNALPSFDAPISEPSGVSPLRRPGSVRRTMTIDATWPGGGQGVGRFTGVCRDVFTDLSGGAPQEIEKASIEVMVRDRLLEQASCVPAHPAIGQLVGARAGGQSRSVIGAALPEEKRRAAPLYLLLDDLAGASLVAQWAWALNSPIWEHLGEEERKAKRAGMVGVCMGLRPGSDAMGPDGVPMDGRNTSEVGPLINPHDPDGWHPLQEYDELNFRRARRIDVWREGDLLHINSFFQDSACEPGMKNRLAVHEYLIEATVDWHSGCLLDISARPGTLPYADCRAAPVNLTHLIGEPLAGFREKVLLTLPRTAGCTHLNDMMRALAEVPALAEHLPQDRNVG